MIDEIPRESQSHNQEQRKKPTPFNRRNFLKMMFGVGAGVVTGAAKETLAQATTPNPEPTPTPLPEFFERPAGPLPSQETELFEREPSYVLDFSTMTMEELRQHVNIQNGENESWQDEWNLEDQMYTDRPENIYFEDGALVLRGRRENYQGKEYTSARFDTQGHFSFTYGRIEFEAMMPYGEGAWGGLWGYSDGDDRNELMRVGIDQGLVDPNDPLRWQIGGEVDIGEVQGGYPNSYRTNWHSLKSRTASANEGRLGHSRTHEVPDIANTWHKYGVEILPDRIRFLLDGQVVDEITPETNEIDEWPVGRVNYHLICNLALGGLWSELIDGEDGQVDFPPHGINNEREAGWRLKLRKISYHRYQDPQQAAAA